MSKKYDTRRFVELLVCGKNKRCNYNRRPYVDFGEGGDMSDKVCALTFDDGPNLTVTLRVLDLLEKHDAFATFFLIGNTITAENRPALQRMLSCGCELANHSFSHRYMDKMSAKEILQEVTLTTDIIREVSGSDPLFFRPPYLAVSETMYQTIPLPFIGGITCEDWEDSVSSEQRAQRILSSVTDGSIILMHDFEGNDKTVLALETILPRLKEKGFSIVTVSRLFSLHGVSAVAGKSLWENIYYTS